MMLLEPLESKQATTFKMTPFWHGWNIIFRVLRVLPQDLDPKKLEGQENMNGGLLSLF